MEVTFGTLLGQTIFWCGLLMAIVLGVGAHNRRLNPVAWAIVGLVPGLNLIGLVIVFARRKADKTVR